MNSNHTLSVITRLALVLVISAGAARACEDHDGTVPPELTARIKATLSAPMPTVQATSATATPIVVNRTRPAVMYGPFVDFSDPPTDAQIVAHRCFSEPFAPTSGPVDEGDNRRMADAITRFHPDATHINPAAFKEVLANPSSRWRMSLLVNMGILDRQAGFFTKAKALWEEAWQIGRSETAPAAKTVADRAIAELIQINAWVGRKDELRHYLDEVGNRRIGGPTGNKIDAARAGLFAMDKEPKDCFKCGPYAVDRMFNALKGITGPVLDERIAAYQTTPRGTSMTEIRDLARSLGMQVQVAKREPGADLIIPSVVHWKLDHYSAILPDEHGFIVQDTTMDAYYGKTMRICKQAIDTEASGYFLVREGPLPAGWTAVPDEEASQVWGRGNTGSDKDPNAATQQDHHCAGCPPGPGMPWYSFLSMLVGLTINDIPVGYTPPIGPDMHFQMTYSDFEGTPYSSFGANWTSNWQSSVFESPIYYIEGYTLDGQPIYGPLIGWNATVYLPGGGSVTYVEDANHGVQNSSYFNGDALFVRVGSNGNAIGYVVSFPDGTTLTYGENGAPTNQLSSITDRYGHSIAFTYDGLKPVAVTDAIGQVTTLSYNGDNTLESITDPFGRAAHFSYINGQLSGVTDVIGMSSSFIYGTQDVPFSSGHIVSMTTPYGTTSFTRGFGLNFQRWIEAKDPNGDSERLEFVQGGLNRDSEEMPSVPGVDFSNGYGLLNNRNSFFWDKKAYKLGTSNYANAINYHWLHSSISGTGRILESMKMPLEGRDWFVYPGQSLNNPVGETGITIGSPALVAKVLDDGSTQVTRYGYNGSLIGSSMDPVGREVNLTYQGIDVTKLVQGPAGTGETLFTATYDTAHHPLTISDAAGNGTTLTYTALGEVATVTNALNQTTTFSYDTNGYLQTVTDPLLAQATFIYDAYGRMRTATGPDGDSVTMSYDALDRPTLVTYGDGTSEEIVWDRLDPAHVRDRRGRWTHRYYNDLRQVEGIVDPLGQVTVLKWCRCGALDTLIDAAGHATHWVMDVQGRLLSKTLPDGHATTYAYEPRSGRLASMTDAKNQTTVYHYTIDDRISSIDYLNAQEPTPSEAFAYDPVYPRLVGITDGTGATAITYYPRAQGQLGGGQVASVTGPLPGATITYGYDQLGRLSARTVLGATESMGYDPLGRINEVMNALGTFTYAYQGSTGRVSSITSSTGLVTELTYGDLAHDFRLASIAHRFGANPISRFDYGYLPDGTISTWTRTTGGEAPTTWTYGYDTTNQLLSARLDGPSGVLSDLSYGYDAIGNRTLVRNGAVTAASVFNVVNQFAGGAAAGSLRVAGHVSKPAQVSVNGQPARQPTATTFEAQVPVSGNQAMIPVHAVDGSGNASDTTFAVPVEAAAQAAVHVYDSNGNLVSDGTRTYAWDAKNRMVRITMGSHVSSFTYDALDRRVTITETETGQATTTASLVWDGADLAAQLSNGTVDRRFFGQGEMIGGELVLYTADHLGSVREMVDVAGNVRARYDYDPYGVQTKVSGDLEAGIGYAGYRVHGPSGMNLTLFRGYDPKVGKWLSRDPLGESGGLNLYAYCLNNPVNWIDAFGLEVTFTFTDGTTKVINTAKEFLAVLKAHAVPSQYGTIKDISFRGHGNSHYQFFNGGQNDRATGDLIELDPNTGHLLLVDSGLALTNVDLPGLLDRALAIGGSSIHLGGCKTASTQKSLASELSNQLIDSNPYVFAYVTGHYETAFGNFGKMARFHYGQIFPGDDE